MDTTPAVNDVAAENLSQEISRQPTREFFGASSKGLQIHVSWRAYVALATILVFDTLIIALSLACRAGLLWFMELVVNPDSETWTTSTLEWIADLGLVSTAALIAILDFLVRIRRAWKEFSNEFKH